VVVVVANVACAGHGGRGWRRASFARLVGRGAVVVSLKRAQSRTSNFFSHAQSINNQQIVGPPFPLFTDFNASTPLEWAQTGNL
jgi:hypothetical protein